MKTFDQFITEGKKKEARSAQRETLKAAWERGRIESDMDTPPQVMTIKQVLKNSGGKAVLKHLAARDKRRDTAVKGIMKKYPGVAPN
jgi:hypothetical protein